MDLGISDRVKPILAQVQQFVEQEIRPFEAECYNEVSVGDRWQLTQPQYEIMDGLKAKARSQGLWNFFLTGENEYGSGLNTVEYAYLAEAMASSPMGPEVFNCAAPDTGNMEVLEKYGTPEQQAEWLAPMLRGEIKSCFGMTEPSVASSDATNISTTAVLEGDEYVINGEKHWISGAGDPRCKIMICMVVTNPDAAQHARQSQILVPMDNPGVEIVGPMLVFGHDDAPHGHMHIRLNNVRVPASNMLLGEGRGFEISQGRLGPGRIHHCMRSIGVAEKALELLCQRGMTRTALANPLSSLVVILM